MANVKRSRREYQRQRFFEVVFSVWRELLEHTVLDCFFLLYSDVACKFQWPGYRYKYTNKGQSEPTLVLVILYCTTESTFYMVGIL